VRFGDQAVGFVEAFKRFFDLVTTLFDCSLRGVATFLGNFVISAGSRVRHISSLPIVAYLSRGLDL
jgi:hypothetical protein